MKKFENNNTLYNLGDLNKKNSLKRSYTYEMQHSSLFIANKLSASFSTEFENKIKELNNIIKNLKTQLQKKEEEIKSLKNNLPSESLKLMPKSINNLLKIKEKAELQEVEKAFLEDKLNQKMKEIGEKGKKNSNIDLIEVNSKEIEKELKEEKKIKSSILSKKDKDKIQNFRKKFFLKEEDYSDEKIFDALKENNYDFYYAFASFFHD
jgi:hypothetical protein